MPAVRELECYYDPGGAGADYRYISAEFGSFGDSAAVDKDVILPLGRRW